MTEIEFLMVTDYSRQELLHKLLSEDVPTFGINISRENEDLIKLCDQNNINPTSIETSAIQVVARHGIHFKELPRLRIMGMVCDLDTIGAMALVVCNNRHFISAYSEAVQNRINDIGQCATYIKKGCPVYKEPKKGDRWPGPYLGYDINRGIAILNAAIQDPKPPLGNKVHVLHNYLVRGEIPGDYFMQVERARDELIASLTKKK